MFIRQAKTRSQSQLQFMGKRLFLFIILGLIAFGSYAQRPLSDSRQSSYYTYIYKIADEDLQNFYIHPEKRPDDKILYHPIDSFKTGKTWKNTLPPGNYAMAHLERNNLVYQLVENHSALLQVITNNYDLRFIITGSDGKQINNAAVSVKNSPVAFDLITNSYHINSLKPALVKVVYAGVTNYFQLNSGNNYTLKFLSK